VHNSVLVENRAPEVCFDPYKTRVLFYISKIN